VQSVHTLAGEGDLGKLIGKLVRPIGGSVVVPITAQVFDDRKLRRGLTARRIVTLLITPRAFKWLIAELVSQLSA
jgi:hypothetical protein